MKTNEGDYPSHKTTLPAVCRLLSQPGSPHGGLFFSMKLLATTFKHLGWTYEQVFRQGNIAVFRAYKGNIDTWETIRVQSHAGYQINGKQIPPAEFYPRAEDWGTNGFTFTNFADAMAKAKELAAK